MPMKLGHDRVHESRDFNTSGKWKDNSGWGEVKDGGNESGRDKMGHG